MTFENIKLNLVQGYIAKQLQLLKANYKGLWNMELIFADNLVI